MSYDVAHLAASAVTQTQKHAQLLIVTFQCDKIKETILLRNQKPKNLNDRNDASLQQLSK